MVHLVPQHHQHAPVISGITRAGPPAIAERRRRARHVDGESGGRCRRRPFSSPPAAAVAYRLGKAHGVGVVRSEILVGPEGEQPS